jgi:uncharacterized DUF497 family protein
LHPTSLRRYPPCWPIESDGEQRYQLIGMTKSLALLFVVFVDRSARDAEVIHPISARRAVDYEKSIYEDQFL